MIMAHVRPTFGNFGNALLERGNPGIRRSTPDSEALASSDEEIEQSRLRSVNSRKALANRRSSLLQDQGTEARRASVAGSSSYSPNPGSLPNTPGAGHDAWSAISPSTGAWNNGTSYPFGSSIWGARDPPARLQEVQQEADGRIPFSIPSQPVASTYRSMSFSVGQSDPEQRQMTPESARPVATLQRRSSRQSNIGSEISALRRVSEVDDFQSEQEIPTPQQYVRPQNRTFSSSAAYGVPASFRGNKLRGVGLGESENAVEETEESSAQIRYAMRNTQRRLSDYPLAQPSRAPTGPLYSNSSHRAPRTTTYWSTGGEFDQLDTIPQSRRHSFADVPTRRGSLGSNDEHSGSFAGSQSQSQDLEATYFAQSDVNRRLAEQEVQQQIQQERSQALFGGAATYGLPPNLGAYHGPSSMPLYVVNFKCCRSDIFYIQEGTGLSVQPGDLVIVEADRGTDLGCVQHTGITWEEARKYKTRYAEQHYGWLMMFSQQTRSGAPNLFNPNAAPARNGMGGAGSGHRDPSEIKPKMIKRLAQQHEIQALQEKEGNEAKAKRVCQQKVQEHSLNMEILDAEFQMDSKKLTFYFFSTEYINFNLLVTDLFKIYKTRIWMSAINPASFQTPTSSLGLTPIYGNGPPGVQHGPIPDNGYDEPRDMGAFVPQPRQNMQNVFYGAQSPNVAPSLFNGYGAAYQPASDPFAGYNGYGAVQTPRGSSFTMGRPGLGSMPRKGPMHNPQSLASSFGALSLDRYEPTST